MEQTKPFYDPSTEDQKLDLHARHLNDTVLVSQAYHALSTTLRKYNVDISPLADVYYPIYLEFSKKSNLTYENIDSPFGSKVKD